MKTISYNILRVAVILFMASFLFWIIWKLPSARVYAAIGVLPLIVFVLWKVPQWQVASLKEPITAAESADLEDKFRKTIAQILGGAAIIASFYGTWKTLEISRENLEVSQARQITDRYTRAIDQLGNKQMEVTLGGIFALAGIARDSDDYYWPVIQVLIAYVRGNAAWDERKPLSWNQQKPGIEVQTVLNVIGRNLKPHEKSDYRTINLAGLDLRGADFQALHFERANFEGTQLHGANFEGAHLEGANFYKANLKKAIFKRAFLNNANFSGAHLENTDFIEARLPFAKFLGAYMQKSDLRDAEIIQAYFEGADLTKASFGRSNVKNTSFVRADICGVNFEGVKELTREQIDSAIVCDETKLPEYLKTP